MPDEPERGMLNLRTDEFPAWVQRRAFYIWRLEDLLRDLQRSRLQADYGYIDPGAEAIRNAFEQMMAAWYPAPTSAEVEDEDEDEHDPPAPPSLPEPARTQHKPRGEFIGHVRKLSAEEVRTIRSTPQNVTLARIASKYGVSTSAIGKVLRRETYKWVE